MITGYYAGLLAFFLIVLSVRVIRLRNVTKTILGMGTDPKLQAACRAQGNFAEYVPIALLMMLMLEMQGTGAGVLHLAGGILILGRVSHAYSLLVREPATNNKDIRFRVGGMICTFTTLAVLAGLLVVKGM